MWNKVYEKLPSSKHPYIKNHSNLILILIKNATHPIIASYNKVNYVFYKDGSPTPIDINLVTHWQELPPLPGKLSRFERLAERMANKFIFNQNVKRKWLTALGIPTNYGEPNKPKILGGYI